MHVTIGHGVTCDIDRLIAGRLLVQANSGGGKTRTLRRLLEQTHGKVQQLVIDPEGEYHTLREKFDYILAAPSGGDTAAHPRTAALLAEKLLQLGVSAILDIYELNPDARQMFVRTFVQALVDAPKALWHPVLVVLDEAHVYAPEGKESASTSAVKALASRGRKRGFALVPATQRLSKLSKDVAAECNSKLIGRCTLDVDIKRAADELGFNTKDQVRTLQALEPGQFYAYGPAFNQTIPTLFTVGPIVTSHAEAGKQSAPVPPPTAKVLKLLPSLADLPAEAEDRARTVEDLKKDNAQLRRQLTEAQKAQPKVETKTVEKPALTEAQIVRAESAVDALAGAVDHATRIWREHLDSALERVGVISAAVKSVRTFQPPIHVDLHVAATPSVQSNSNPRKMVVHRGTSWMDDQASEKLPAGEKAILVALAQQQNGAATRQQLGILTGYKRSSRDAFISRLATKGFVAAVGGGVSATAAGIAALGSDYEPLPTGQKLREYWMARLPEGERAVLMLAFQQYPSPLSRDTVDAETGYKRSSRDAFISRLTTRQLLTAAGRGAVVASRHLFEEE